MARLLLTLLLAFVCPSCARGADLLAAFASELGQRANARVAANVRRNAAAAHAVCRGGTWCDCQCRTDVPGGAGR